MRSLLGVLNIFGSLLTWFALFFALPVLTALIYGELAPLRGFVAGAGVAALGGLLLRLCTQRYCYDLKSRDAYLLVTSTLLIIAAVAAVPLLIDLPGLSFTRAYFEAMSGLSTTGATVLSGLDHLPHSINLWRHALSWLGGMGIIVLAVAVLPLLGGGGMHLSRARAPAVVRLCRPDRCLRAHALGRRHVAVRCDLSRLFGPVAGRILDPRCQHRLFRFAADRIRADDLHADRGDEFRHPFYRAA